MNPTNCSEAQFATTTWRSKTAFACIIATIRARPTSRRFSASTGLRGTREISPISPNVIRPHGVSIALDFRGRGLSDYDPHFGAL